MSVVLCDLLGILNQTHYYGQDRWNYDWVAETVLTGWDVNRVAAVVWYFKVRLEVVVPDGIKIFDGKHEVMVSGRRLFLCTKMFHSIC